MKTRLLILAAACVVPLAHSQPANLCALVTSADVQAIVKEPVTGAQPLKYTRGCRYGIGTHGDSVTLNFLNTAGDAKAEYEGQKRLQASVKPQAVAGVGDEAIFGLVLIARKGERVLVVEPQALPETRRRERAIALARLALEKNQ